MKSKFFSEFKEFAMRGNVIDLAVGVVIGGAFGKIVSSVVSDIIMPPIGLLIGGINFTDLTITLKHATANAAGEAMPAVAINIGNFLQATIDFLIIAFAIFLFVRLINGMSRKQKEAEAAKPAEPAADIKLLTEIRDLLKKDNKK